MSYAMIAIRSCYVLSVLILLGLLFVTLPVEARGTAAMFAAFGLWSFLCAFLGAWATYRKQNEQPPVPQFDPDKMFNWIKTGQPETNSTNTYEPPPFETPDANPTEWSI